MERAFESAMAAHVLQPLGLEATGFAEPDAPARGHMQEGESGHRAVSVDRIRRCGGPRAGSGRRSATCCASRRTTSTARRRSCTSRARDALGAQYALGWWVREHIGGRTTLDHEGSIAGYQSLLLLVPANRLALAVLTNSWRGSGLARRVVESLGLIAASRAVVGRGRGDDIAGAYELDGAEAVVETADDGVVVTEAETDPVTGTRRTMRYRRAPIGDGVYGFAGGTLMSHRLDFPRPGVARIGWVALPRVER